MRGRPFGDRRSGRNAAERGIATVFKEKRMPRRHPFVLAGSVSRVLYSAARFRCGAPVIYLRRQSPAASSNLPPGIGRATLDCRYTWSCNPRDVLPGDITAPAVGSYPAFSPLPAGVPSRDPTGGHSLLRSHTLTDIKSLACVALCVARTFLPRPTAGSDRAGLRRKGTQSEAEFKTPRRVRGSFSPSGTSGRACSGTAGPPTSGSRRRPGGA